jgi:hypothetical protein
MKMLISDVCMVNSAVQVCRLVGCRQIRGISQYSVIGN